MDYPNGYQYPKEVQEKLKILDTYKENNTMNKFNLFHLYPKELAFPNGYYDSRFFELVGFNTTTMEKRNLGRHDGMNFSFGECVVDTAQVYADGAFLIKLKHLVKTDNISTGLIYIEPVK